MARKPVTLKLMHEYVLAETGRPLADGERLLARVVQLLEAEGFGPRRAAQGYRAFVARHAHVLEGRVALLARPP